MQPGGRDKSVIVRRVSVLLVLGIVAIVVGSGCAGTERAKPSELQDIGNATRAYGSTLPAHGPSRLMRVDELRPLVAFGYDIREQPVLDPRQFSLSSVRGPCGATITTPFTDEKHVRIFRSTVTLVIEAIAEPGPEEAKKLVEAFRADARPGCADFEETIGVGPSKVRYAKSIDLPNVGDERLGWTDEVRNPDGKVGYRSEIVVRDGGIVAFFVIIAASREVDPTQFGELLRAASQP